MTPSGCGQLDDFLDGTLSVEERATFLRHLEECDACRRAVQEQERVHQLLRRAVIELEAVPDGLTARLRSRMRRTARQQLLRRVTGLAAAVVLIVLGMWWLRRPLELPLERVENTVPTNSAAPLTHAQAYVRFRSPAITVPVQTKSPNVTMVWVYPLAEKGASPPSDEPSISERNEP